MNKLERNKRDEQIRHSYEILVQKQGKRIPAQIIFLADLYGLTTRHIRNILKEANV